MRILLVLVLVIILSLSLSVPVMGKHLHPEFSVGDVIRENKTKTTYQIVGMTDSVYWVAVHGDGIVPFIVFGLDILQVDDSPMWHLVKESK